MLILGIDPGIALTGYGLVDSAQNRLHAVEYGCIETPAKMPVEDRLLIIYDAMCDLLARHKPEEVAIEQLFFNRNVTTAFSVGQARGVMVLACVRHGLRVREYTPLQVKQGIAGYGGADKKQIQTMVRMLLGLAEVPKPDDVADALAIAITHAHAVPWQTRVEKRTQNR